MPGCGGHIELSEQGWIALCQFHDHLDKRFGAHFLEVFTNAHEGTGAFSFSIAARRVRRQRGRNHVFAKAPVLERGARALAIDRLAASCQRDCIVRGASDYGSHPSRLDGKDLHQAIAKIVLAACEYLRPSKLPQRVNAKAGSSG